MIKSELVIITPVYEDSESFYQLAQKIENIYSDKVSLIAIEDGSLRDVIDIKKCSYKLNTHIVRLKRNVGHQKAITVGLSYLEDKILDTANIVVMDSDGEDRPETINELLTQFDKKKVDIVVSVRKSRVENFQFKFFYQIYRVIFQLLTGYKINFGNFMAMNLPALRRLLTYVELPVHLAGTVILSKLRVRSVLIDRGPRYAGQSKMNFASLVLHGLKALMIFSDYVLVRLGLASLFFVGMIGIVMILTVFLKSIGLATPGWFSIVLGMLTLLLIQIAAFVLMFLMQSNNKSHFSDYSNDLIGLISNVDRAN